MSEERLILRPLDLDGDAERLAAMWNASDDQWPGTFTGGVPFTAERVRSWLSREGFVEAMVWDAGEEIAGFCSLWKESREENVYYIALLNVAPAYQQLSLGRKFLTYYVRRITELGADRLDLHTWPGNLKAVPLYKKCGFFWMPKTGVYMLNFLPAILRLPLAQPFFARHDWYRAFTRALTQEEDDERWEGMKVFTYCFEADGERLTVWVDRQSRTITAVETDDLVAAALPVELEPPRGLATTMRWKLTNKRDRPLSVALIATGTEQLRLDYRTIVQLPHGDSITLEAPVQLAPDMPDVRGGDPAPCLTSILVIDGQPLELRSGLLPRAAVEVSTFPAEISLTPGVTQQVRLQLRSRITRAVTATVSLAVPEGVTAEWTARTVTLDAEGRAGIPLTLTAASGEVHTLQAAIRFPVDGEMVYLPVTPLPVFALSPGAVLGVKEQDRLRIENSRVRVFVRARAGRVDFHDRQTGEWIGGHHAYPAPPVEPSEYHEADFALSLEEDGAGVTAVAVVDAKAHPHFRFVKRVRVTAGPVVQIDSAFVNLGAEEQRFQLCQGSNGRFDDSTITVPLASGITQGKAADFPGHWDDAFKQPGAYSERWMAAASSRGTMGALWPDDAEEVYLRSGVGTLSRAYTCPPQSTTRPGGMRIYLGDGDWRQVRHLWLQEEGRLTADLIDPAPRQALAARLDPLPVVTDTPITTALKVEHAIPRTTDGVATLLLPPGWSADRTSTDFAGVNWQHPHETPIHLTTTAKPGAYSCRIAVRTPECDLDIDTPLFRLGNGRAVAVTETEREGQRVLTVDNGRLAFDVAPDFSGAVVALREGEIDHLASPFPAVSAFGWMSPWYGGITPYLTALDGFPGKLHRETFHAEQVTLSSDYDFRWTGVRQRATLQHEEGRGLIIEIDTLTLGGSPVIKLAMRVRNTTTAAQRHAFGFGVFTQPDGSRAQTTLLGPQFRRKHSERYADILAGHWAAAMNPATRRGLALVSPTPRVHLEGNGNLGGHLLLLPTRAIPAEGTAEVAAFLALAQSEKEAELYGMLRELA